MAKLFNATIVGRTVNLSINSDYKDTYIIIRGLVLSADADLKVTEFKRIALG